MLIDTDVHEYLRSKHDLVPYLNDYWQHHFREYDFDKSTRIPSAFPYAVPGAFRDEWTPEDGARATDLDRLREHLFDGEGVTLGILNGFFHTAGMVGNFELAQALTSAYNDWQIDQLLEKEPRLCGSVHVVTHDPAAAVREIDRVAEHPQIVQVFLPTVTDRQYGDPYYRPIFEAAVRHGLAVALHHGGETQTLLGYPRYFIEWHALAAPHAAMNQMMSVICNGVFDALPELKLIVLESGVAWVPWFMWRADQQYRELRAEVPWVKRLPSEHIRDSIRVATQPLSDVAPRDFACLVEMTESERVFVFATDYPHFDADSADRVLTGAIPEDLRNRIRYGNALESYPRLPSLVA